MTVRLKIGIAYGSDVHAFRTAMLEVAHANPNVMVSPPVRLDGATTPPAGSSP